MRLQPEVLPCNQFQTKQTGSTTPVLQSVVQDSICKLNDTSSTKRVKFVVQMYSWREPVSL